MDQDQVPIMEQRAEPEVNSEDILLPDDDEASPVQIQIPDLSQFIKNLNATDACQTQRDVTTGEVLLLSAVGTTRKISKHGRRRRKEVTLPFDQEHKMEK